MPKQANVLKFFKIAKKEEIEFKLSLFKSLCMASILFFKNLSINFCGFSVVEIACV